MDSAGIERFEAACKKELALESQERQDNLSSKAGEDFHDQQLEC